MIDTDILIDNLRGFSPGIDFLDELSEAGSFIVSIVSGMELVQGCRNAAELRPVRRLLQRATVLPVEAPISELAYRLMDSYFLSHRLVLTDAFIAATALHHERTLYTRNIRHFQMIPGLAIVRPY